MKELKGDIWELAPKVGAICITTNGAIRNDGACVMGRGVALEAKKKFPGMDIMLGYRIENSGNVVHDLGFTTGGYYVFSFPVKHHWKQDADLLLIHDSAEQLVELCDKRYSDMEKILVPRPGCGNGNLDWKEQVKPVIEPILDDRFGVITNE
jgi:hypothetical protein